MKKHSSLFLMIVLAFHATKAQENPDFPNYKDWRRPTSTSTTNPLPTDIKYWFRFYRRPTLTMASELAKLVKVSAITDESLNQVLYAMSDLLHFFDEARLTKEVAAVSEWSEVDDLSEGQQRALDKYSTLLSEVMREKAAYDNRTIHDRSDAQRLLGLANVHAKENTDFRSAIQWEEVQNGLTCVSHGTVSCLKAAQPLLANLLFPETLHKQIKAYEESRYGYAKPRSGVYSSTLVSFLKDFGYRVDYDALNVESQPIYVDFLTKNLFSQPDGTLTMDPSSANVVLKAEEYAVLPYNRSIQKLTVKVKEANHRPKHFESALPYTRDKDTKQMQALDEVLKRTLSLENPVLPIVMLDSYHVPKKNISQVTYKELPVYAYEFDPEGMGHAVTIAGYDVCPWEAGMRNGDTCYLVRDSLRAGNYGWVPLSNLHRRTIDIVFLTNTRITFDPKQ